MSRLELLLHPVRIRIVESLSGREMTTLQLHDVLDDVPVATLYRHVDRLIDGGVIDVVGERRVRGGIERQLRLVDEAASLGPDDITSAADAERAFRAFLAALLARARRSLAAFDGDDPDRISFRHIPLWLTDDEYDELAERFRAALEPALANPRQGRRRHVLTLVSLPEP